MKRLSQNFSRRSLIEQCCYFLNCFFADHESYDDSMSSQESIVFYRSLCSAAEFVELCSRHDERNYFKVFHVDIDLVRTYCLISLTDILSYE